jgi:hypothetical protein
MHTRAFLLSLSFFAASALSGAEDRVSLIGQVLDPSGRSLEHATVLVYHAGVKTGYSTFCPSCYVDCGKRAVTDTNGSFTIRNLSSDLLFELLVVRDGYFSGSVKSVDPSKGPAPVAVLKPRQNVSDPERVVRGRVVDSHGAPLRDVVVRPQGVLIDEPEQGHVAMYGTIAGLDLIAVTNERGEFEVSYDRPALQVLLLVEARGFAPKLFNHLPTGTDRKVLTVTEGAILRGCLIDHGKPVAGAQIGLIARQRSGGAELKLNGSPYDEIRVGTQPDGRFVITNVPIPVEWYAYGKMESIAQRGATAPVEFKTVADNQDVDIGDVQVIVGCHLRGRVVLSDDKPITDGMRVYISADGIADSQTALLQPNGGFEFTGLAPGKYLVWASVKGYQGVAWDYRSGQERPGTVRIQRDTGDFVLTLNPVK